MKRLFRFLKALVRYILHGKRVDFYTYQHRLEKCSDCEFLDMDKWSCKVCGCYVDKKAKMSTEECPVNVWRKVHK